MAEWQARMDRQKVQKPTHDRPSGRRNKASNYGRSAIAYRIDIDEVIKRLDKHQQTQVSLARRINVSDRHLNRVLRGHSFPSFELAEAIYAALGIQKKPVRVQLRGCDGLSR